MNNPNLLYSVSLFSYSLIAYISSNYIKDFNKKKMLIIYPIIAILIGLATRKVLLLVCLLMTPFALTFSCTIYNRNIGIDRLKKMHLLCGVILSIYYIVMPHVLDFIFSFVK